MAFARTHTHARPNKSIFFGACANGEKHDEEAQEETSARQKLVRVCVWKTQQAVRFVCICVCSGVKSESESERGLLCLCVCVCARSGFSKPGLGPKQTKRKDKQGRRRVEI